MNVELSENSARDSVPDQQWGNSPAVEGITQGDNLDSSVVGLVELAARVQDSIEGSEVPEEGEVSS